MSKFNIFNNKKKLQKNSNNYEMDSNIQSEMDTGELGEKISFGWLSKIKVIPISIGAFAALIGAIIVYVDYTNTLDKNRQATAHISDLKQLSERIEKNSILVRNGNPVAFNELEISENKIDKLLEVLQKGGKINENDTEISSLKGQLTEKFNKVKSEWSNNKPLIDALILNKKGLLNLKDDTLKVKSSYQPLLDSIVILKKKLDINSPLVPIVEEMFLLSNRITLGLDDLFAGENFFLTSGYSLIKDLRVLNSLILTVENGNITKGIPANTNPEIDKLIKDVDKNFLPFKLVTENIVPQVATLYSAKDVAKEISLTSHQISLTAEELNKEYVVQALDLNYSRTLAILFFIIALFAFGLLALVFYERSLQALRFAKILEKNQANESAVNTLIEQMLPLDQGDFTKKIFTEDKFVLPIAEKVDNTREAFGNIVRKIKGSATAVQYSANETDKHSQELLIVADKQFVQMEATIEQLTRITSEMDEVAQTTWFAQDQSNQSRDASKDGGKLVQESINKMVEIRNTIQDSAKKIKKSSESAQAITEVTGLIQSITRQIEVLALNAAIQAASSGESGREFTVVAQEVQRLAFDSKEATDKILVLVKEVQEDIGGAVFSMEKTTQEVVQGAKLNDSAGQALKKIEELSQKVADRVSEASQRLEEKSIEMASISLSMREVQEVTRTNTKIVKATVDEVEALKQLSKELEGSVHGFKVDN